MSDSAASKLSNQLRRIAEFPTFQAAPDLIHALTRGVEIKPGRILQD